MWRVVGAQLASPPAQRVIRQVTGEPISHQCSQDQSSTSSSVTNSSRNLVIILGDPRKMFTDSSFYSAKHHPTVADQVEMAHKLSSAMFNEKNK